MDNKVYILHKSGEKSHYLGLSELLKQENQKLVYREFSVMSKLLKSMTKLDFKTFSKQFVNLSFLISLFFTKNKKIVVGIAPFDAKLSRLLPLFKGHQIYYHTSWAHWDGSFVPKSKKTKQATKDKWKLFLEEIVKHVFAVTTTAKNQLIENYHIKASNVSVVNHAFNNIDFNYKETQNQDLSFICVGRLRPDKGIQEILTYFSENRDKQITFVGKGDLESLIKTYESKYSNIFFEGYVKDKTTLARLFNQHNYMLLNSKKTKKWEELFGMVLIEGMACGLIPVATNHAGPKEIISSDFGYLFEEADLNETLNKISKIDVDMKDKAVKASQKYAVAAIANQWKAILK